MNSDFTKVQHSKMAQIHQNQTLENRKTKKMVKVAGFEASKSLKLISRKIWLAGKSKFYLLEYTEWKFRNFCSTEVYVK